MNIILRINVTTTMTITTATIKTFPPSFPLLHSSLRQSSGFSRVRSWGVREVTTWLTQLGASERVVETAKTAGVIDGPSFLKLASGASFSNWGVRSKLTLLRMEKALLALREEDEDDGNANGEQSGLRTFLRNSVNASSAPNLVSSVSFQKFIL